MTAQQAPITPRFTYQGRLAQTGAVVNGVCDFEFGLWDSATGGSQIGPTNTAAGLSVTGGLFSVGLNFLDNAFDGTARYLEIDVVCPSGSGGLTTLTPRQPIIGVPQAAFAIEAKQVEWTGLLNTPGGLDDGDDDTQLSSAEVRSAVSGATIDLAAGSRVNGAAISVGNHTTDSFRSDGEIRSAVSGSAIALAIPKRRQDCAFVHYFDNHPT